MVMILGTDERRKRMVTRNNNAYGCWMSLVFFLVSSDWATAEPHYHPMEDAIAGKDVHRACRRSGVTLLCRLEDLKESDLDRLDPCLCTHLIYTTEMAGFVPESWRKYSPELKFLMATSLIRWTQGGSELSVLLSEMRKGHFDGVDIAVGEEAEEAAAVTTLQELVEMLKGDQRIISLTFFDGGLPEQTLSQINLALINYVTDFGKTDSKQGVPVPENKILFGFSVADLRNDGVADGNDSQICAAIGSLKTDEESGGYEYNSKMKNTINKVQHAIEDGKMGGIYIRSLESDDTTGACGVGSFPTLRFIRNKLNRDREPFGNFADLDIVLSTGESQEVQFVLDVETPREDLKKLPCERVGFYRHPMDCTKFYHCSEYRASTTRFNESGPYAGFLYKCPSGLVYDERQGSCIWPSWSDPCRGSGELLPVPAKKFSCFTPGFHVDPENCRYFYYCSDLGDGMLEAFEFLCPSDLLGFDEKKLLCNWKWTVSECSSNGKVSDASTYSNKQGKPSSRYRTSKALSLQYIPSLPVFIPSPESFRENIVVKNKTPSKSNASLDSENQAIVSRNDTPNVLHKVPISNNFISNKELEKHYDGKLGTAIWQRPKTDQRRTNNNNNNTSSHVYSYSNGFGLSREYLLENKTEPERPFKGKVIKLDLSGRIDQNSNPIFREKKQNEEIAREINYGLQTPDFKTTNEHEKNYVIFDNVDHNDADRSDRRPSPFPNVKCSKLLSKNQEHEDVNTLGCIGEVSLTVKLNRRKDINKYTLREDQITKRYQESQRISHLKSLTEGNVTYNENQNQDTVYKSRPKSAFFFPLENKMRNMSKDLQGEIHKSGSISAMPDNLDFHTENNLAIKITDSAKLKPAENPSQFLQKTKLPVNYETDTELFDENGSLSDKNRKVTGSRTTELGRNQVVKSDSMPIHFYPQGVLLNINLGHVNRIPPDVLLEVDHMLKKYMDEGRIDANLLGKKLNASVEKMAPEQHRNTEPEEITDMIRIIENIISPFEVQDPVVTETIYSQYDKIDSTSIRTQGESATTPAAKVSDKVIASEFQQPQGKLKIEIEQNNSKNVPLNTVQNVTKTRPFGRGRLLRKFKYPSIREQLDQQVGFQVSNPEDGSKLITNNESPTYSFPPYTYPLRISQYSDKAIRTSFNRLPIHHVSMPASNENAIQTSVSPLKGQQKNNAHPENHYGSPLAEQDSTFPIDDRNDQHGRFSQQDDSSIVDRGPSIPEPSSIGQQYRYSQQEGQSSVNDYGLPKPIQNQNLQRTGQNTFVDHGLPATIQEKNDQRDSYFQHRGQNSFLDYGLRVTVQDQNDQQGRSLQHRDQNLYLEHGSAITIQDKNDQPVQYLQHRNQISVTDHGLPVVVQGKNGQRGLHVQSEGQFFVDHGLPVTVELKNDQQDRNRQQKSEAKAAEDNSLQGDRENINSGAWKIYAGEQLAEITARKIQDASNFDSQRNKDLLYKSDGIRRYHEETHGFKNEQHESNKQTYPDFPSTKDNAYDRRLGLPHRTTEAEENYDSLQNKPHSVSFENESHFMNDNDRNAKNSFISISEKLYQHNTPFINDDEKSYSFDHKRSGDLQANEKQKGNAGSVSRDSTSNKQTRKRKKLRILVKKLEDGGDLNSPTVDDRREIEERISKSVLKSLKNRILQKHAESIELQIQYQGHVWNIPFVNNESDLSPTICTRPGLFQHPRDCNMFYECFWDKWLTRFTLHVFACPVRLVYDHNVRGCSRPSTDSPCNNHTS